MEIQLFYALALAVMVIAMLKPELAAEFAGLLGDDDAGHKRERPAWERLLNFKKNSSSKPDPAIGEAATAQAETAQQWLDFSKSAYQSQQARQAQQDAIANEVTNQQLNAAQQQQEWAQQDRNRYNNIYRPLEDQQVQDAQNYATVARQNEAANQAAATVAKQEAAQTEATQRQQAARGVDPSSGNATETDRSNSLNTALASATAQNQARDQTRNTAKALQANAINTGRGLPSQAVGTLNSSVGAGTSALQSTQSNNAQAASNYGIMTSGYQGAMAGYANQASILNQQYQNQLQAESANSAALGGLFQGIGTAVGSYFSSKKYKENKKAIPEGRGLSMLKQMPVEEWDYKQGAPGDGGHHIGPYYEDYAKATGSSNGLRAIPIQDSIGITMKAVQDLDAKVDKLAKEKSGGKH